MLLLLQLLSLFELFFHVLAVSNIIVERWVNVSDVIRSVPFTTMTSCYMRCFQTFDCARIGVERNPERSRNEHCKLLKTKGVGRKKRNLLSMYLLLTTDELEEDIKQTGLNKTFKERKTKTCPLWKRVDIIKHEQPIIRNNLITILEKVTRQYFLNVEVKPTGYGKGPYSNIVHFTLGGDYLNYGDRTPAIYTRESTRTFHVSTAVNGNSHFNFNANEAYNFGEWNSIVVSQLKQNNGYNNSITLNGKLSFSMINTQPGFFNNVKVFASGNFHDPQPGLIRVAWIDLYEGECCYPLN